MSASRKIVVDASVAQSAGSGEKENLFSGPSRAVLNIIEAAHHFLVFSRECFQEWSEHEREFARRWRRRMVARKRVIPLGDTTDEALRERLAAFFTVASQRKAILKDAHLVEAACQTDRIVISRDEVVRALFRRACPQIQEIQGVCWANPEIEDERVVDWLESGARNEPARRLGS